MHVVFRGYIIIDATDPPVLVEGFVISNSCSLHFSGGLGVAWEPGPECSLSISTPCQRYHVENSSQGIMSSIIGSAAMSNVQTSIPSAIFALRFSHLLQVRWFVTLLQPFCSIRVLVK